MPPNDKNDEMNEDRDQQSSANDEREPWWADDGPDQASLPEGFPERPDVTRVHELRDRIRRERATREADGVNPMIGKFTAQRGRQVRDIGAYTLIPALMLAGPAAGYGLGWLLEGQFGGKPWVSVFGILFGLLAGFQQIILILKKNSKQK